MIACQLSTYLLTKIQNKFLNFCHLAYVGQGSRLTTTTQLVQDLHPISEAINGVTAAGDITITILLCWLLYHSRTSISRTNYVINRLIVSYRSLSNQKILIERVI